jgi:hypothetical protein
MKKLIILVVILFIICCKNNDVRIITENKGKRKVEYIDSFNKKYSIEKNKLGFSIKYKNLNNRKYEIYVDYLKEKKIIIIALKDYLLNKDNCIINLYYYDIKNDKFIIGNNISLDFIDYGLLFKDQYNVIVNEIIIKNRKKGIIERKFININFKNKVIDYNYLDYNDLLSVNQFINEEHIIRNNNLLCCRMSELVDDEQYIYKNSLLFIDYNKKIITESIPIPHSLNENIQFWNMDIYNNKYFLFRVRPKIIFFDDII